MNTTEKDRGMITRLYVDNYACLVNFELRLTELSLLLGRNGSGKTSVLNVMYALRRLLSGETKITDADTFPTKTLTRWQSRNEQVFEVEVSFDGAPLVYRLEIEHDRTMKRARIIKETLTSGGQPLFGFVEGLVTLYRDDHSKGPQFHSDWSESALARVQPGSDNKRLTRFVEHMKKLIVCGLYPASFVPESSEEEPMLERDAANFAAWYRHLLLERQDLVPEFSSALQPVIDEFRGIRLEKVGLDTRALIVMFDHESKKYELRLSEISDGQRAIIALYALIKLTRDQGYTLFLDEPENYVALVEIQPWLMELSDSCGDAIAQAVICSHHPELIDYFGAERGVLLRRETSGVTTARPVHELNLTGALRLSEVFARGEEG